MLFIIIVLSYLTRFKVSCRKPVPRINEIISCVPQKTHSQQAMTKVKYVLVPDVK
jgi:hypothetical protein